MELVNVEVPLDSSSKVGLATDSGAGSAAVVASRAHNSGVRAEKRVQMPLTMLSGVRVERKPSSNLLNELKRF